MSFVTAFLTMIFIGCNNPSEKHLELESAQTSLEKNLEMYTMVWNEVKYCSKKCSKNKNS